MAKTKNTSKKDKKTKKKDSDKKTTKAKVSGSISSGTTLGKVVVNGTTSMTSFLTEAMNAMKRTTVSGDNVQNLGMRLFGLPYQFTDAVDPRYEGINKTVGHNFAEKFLLEAPVCTFIPGKPKYIPSETSGVKLSITNALINGAAGNLSPLQQLLSENEAQYMRLYDFQTDWTEYMSNVNNLCRIGAGFLGLNETIMVGGEECSFERFDWRNYRWNQNANTSQITRTFNLLKNTKGNKTSNKDTTVDYSAGEKTLDAATKDYQYIQFYIDPEGTSGDSISNSTTQSQFKGMIDQGSNTMKEMSFLLNAGGLNATDAQAFLGDSSKNIMGAITNNIGKDGVVGKAASILGRLTNIAGDVIKGNNVIIPDIYDSSAYSRDSLNITVHLKSPYGTKLSYYLNIFVPMMHLLALACPRQATANSYQGPQLVKAFVEGQFSVNLGIVSGFSISKIGDSRSVDGLPMEVDVTLQIQDLYSDLMLSSPNEPLMFINNSSLVEFLATNCGLSLTSPNYDAKFRMIINTMKEQVYDIPTTIKSAVEEWISQQVTNITHMS